MRIKLTYASLHIVSSVPLCLAHVRMVFDSCRVGRGISQVSRNERAPFELE